MYQINTTKFSGPMDLLLQLIEDRKLEITELALSEVTEQFIAHIEGMEDKEAEELADFLFVAARLLYLKSKALLPEIEEEESLDDLAKQLKLYKEFVDAAKKIQALILEKHFSYIREKLPSQLKPGFYPPEGLRPTAMKSVFLAVLKRLDPLVKLPRQAMEKTVSLQQKILEIRDFLATRKTMNFNTLITDAKSRTEVIVNFLAILELVKQQHLRVRQASLFEEIVLEKL